MEIPGNRLILREFRFSDADDLVRLANDRDVWRNLRDKFPHPYTLADAHGFLAHATSMGVGHLFVIEADGKFAGGCGLHLQEDVYRRTAEIGYWLGRPFWGQGLATDAVRTLTAYAFDEYDLVRLWAGVFAWNPASCRVLEKCGYELEGRLRDAVWKDGALTDQMMYARLRGAG